MFAGLLFLRGVSSDPITIDTMREMPVENGLQQGDVLLEINGASVPGPDGFYGFATQLPADGALSYTVERDGTTVTVPGPHPNPSLALAITPDSAAGDVDMRAGDVITAVDGVSVTTFAQLRDIVGASDGNPLLLNVWRSGQELEFTIVPRRRDLPVEGGGFETRWLIGISGGLFFEPQAVKPGVGQAVSYGVTQTIDTVRLSLSALYNMTLGRIDTCNLQGPIGIAQVAGDAASNGWMSFIGTIALLSVAIGFLNLMPIPVLDGGHLVFHAWEAITGRPPSDGALRILMGVGLTLMIALMVFALSNDLLCP
ncbi:MAG: site-2 protease family protein [Pseudomonadota bacterium]